MPSLWIVGEILLHNRRRLAQLYIFVNAEENLIVEVLNAGNISPEHSDVLKSVAIHHLFEIVSIEVVCDGRTARKNEEKWDEEVAFHKRTPD